MKVEWEKVKLSEICKTISDGDHLPPPKAEVGIPFVTIANINNNQFDFSDTMFVTKEYFDNVDEKRKPKSNDILYSVVGSFGIPVFIKEEKDFVFQRHIAILRPDVQVVDPRFLYYVMLSNNFYAKADAVALGAAQRTVSLTSLRNIEIQIPDFTLQQKIAAFLGAYDDLIENNRKQIKLLEEAVQKLYKEWFVELHFPGWENTKIVDGIPEGWKKQKFFDVFDYTRGVSYSSEELNSGNLLINLKNIKAFGGYKRNVEKRYSGKFNDKQVLANGDILMGITDMTKERRLVGHVAKVPKLKEKAVYSMDLIKISPKIVSKNFLYYSFRFGNYDNQVSLLANGTNVLHLKPESMKSLDMIIPTNEVVSLFDEITIPFDEKIELLEDSISSLRITRDKLLPKLMSGEIDVSEIKLPTVEE